MKNQMWDWLDGLAVIAVNLLGLAGVLVIFVIALGIISAVCYVMGEVINEVTKTFKKKES